MTTINKDDAMTQTFTQAQWIWSGDEQGYNDYRQAEHRFTVSEAAYTALRHGAAAELHITADALYQVWLNGSSLGHGPAKSAKGRRSVDTYDLAAWLRHGENVLEIVVLALGAGNMCYCFGLPGLIFEIAVAKQVVAASGTQTRMRKDRRRRQDTVRRWILPCVEDFNAGIPLEAWLPAKVVQRSTLLYPRRVPLPTREAVAPQRMILADRVGLPNVSISFRHKPYLVSPEENLKHNNFETKSLLVTDIVSPVAQTLVLTPTRGAVTWYHEGRVVVQSRGWNPWKPGPNGSPRIELRAGANRLVGIHRYDHFTELNLAGRCPVPVTFVNPFGAGGFQVIRGESGQLPTPDVLPEPDWAALTSRMPAMDPIHTMVEANAQDLVLGAEILVGDAGVPLNAPASQPIILPPAAAGTAVRVVVDLGAVHSGWLAFRVRGRHGSRLMVSCFEGLAAGPPLRLHWTYGCENVLTYRCGDGVETFESFLPYGVRYLAVHHTGEHPLELSDLRLLTANCGSRRQGSFQCSDPMLNRIYDMAVQTILSGTDDTFTDCPTYEQVNWNFDNRTAWLGEVLSCANTAVAWNSIVLFAEDPEMTGVVRSQYPSAWDHHIPLWSMHWILWCRDFIEATGDRESVVEIIPRIRAGLEDLLGRIGPRGLLEWPGVSHLIDYGPGRDDNHAINAGEQAILVAAFAAGAELAVLAGEDAARWCEARDRLVQAINRELWVPAREAYADSIHADGAISPVSSQTTNAMMCLYGVTAPQRTADLARRIADQDPALVAYGSPYGLYYILEMYDALGMVEPLFAAIRKRWGDMAQAGDATMWELFADSGGHYGFPTRSRCHPFAAYVIKYLIANLGGIRFASRGSTTCRIEPRSPQGITFCQCSVPTAHGLIRVGWNLASGGTGLAVELPAGCRRI